MEKRIFFMQRDVSIDDLEEWMRVAWLNEGYTIEQLQLSTCLNDDGNEVIMTIAGFACK